MLEEGAEVVYADKNGAVLRDERGTLSITRTVIDFEPVRKDGCASSGAAR